ncbi:RHS repeat-associated core domain-containing protein [Nitrincola alkalilacustris]|uniref:RHS repeat-associated core domain-containing protein n=1 Tax=Nitrincola alkalilacustris TaxID=1571224 RepID=UPI0014565D90|nr:RHS repeat-associated core domain-containing protein [Nitrincola alkalilacustris]
MGHTQFRYDDAGNLIERRAPQDLQTLQYDGLHRLSCVKRQRPGYPTTETYYIYDALSRRICKQIIPERSQSHSIRYGWDGDQLVHEDTGDQRTTVFYEPGSFVPLFRVDETKRPEEFDEHWMLREPQESASEPGYDTHHYSAFVTDHLGTPLKLLGSDGHLLWTAKPDDWCAVRDEKAVPDLKQPIRFQGQWLDEETGLYYNRYRYYDPRQGRYITQDPIGLAGGMKSYAYVRNPTGWVGPLGLSDKANWPSIQVESVATDPDPIVRVLKTLIAYGRMAGGGLQVAAGKGMCASGILCSIGAPLATQGAGNIGAGVSDYLEILGYKTDLNATKHAYDLISEGNGEKIFSCADLATGAAGLAAGFRQVPVVIDKGLTITQYTKVFAYKVEGTPLPAIGLDLIGTVESGKGCFGND